jgi:hypothetical protein
MLRNLLLAAACAAIAAAGVTDAMAGSSTDFGKHHARPAAHSVPQHRRVVHREFPHGIGSGPAAYYAVAPKVSVFHGPGYLYVPRKGIVDEACNLPTSACPNEMRDVR